ncbi:MAG: type II secretion system F family protein [Planctomycetes bacterium]|nr:type II secretion system F family protein [Planctomycetota bacterium]
MPEKLSRRVDVTPQTRASVAEAPAPTAASGGGGRSWLRGGRLKPRDLVELTRTMATLSDAGLPIVKSLQILEGQQKPGPVKRVLAQVVEDVSSGTTLSDSLAKHPALFDSLFVNMVRAGEASGELDKILAQLSDYLEKSQLVRDRVKGASIYPTVVLVVAAVLMVIIFLVVIPKFEVIFASFQMELPWQTQLLIGGSRFLVDYWYIVFGIPVLLWILHFTLMRRAAKYRFKMHTWALRSPVVGGVLSKVLIARFARTFGTLVQSGVPHLEGLSIVRGSLGNDKMSDAVDQIRTRVREGEGLAVPMGESRVFDDVIVNLVNVGESTGELDRMLLRVSDTYEADVNRRLDAAFKILEPSLLLAMAVVVGFIVVALFLPLLKIMDSLGQQG